MHCSGRPQASGEPCTAGSAQSLPESTAPSLLHPEVAEAPCSGTTAWPAPKQLCPAVLQGPRDGAGSVARIFQEVELHQCRALKHSIKEMVTV